MYLKLTVQYMDREFKCQERGSGQLQG